jgi:hypothetical protein
MLMLMLMLSDVDIQSSEPMVNILAHITSSIIGRGEGLTEGFHHGDINSSQPKQYR